MRNGSPGFVERALGYAALSYGFGFLVVMLHTARLGFPVIALLDPIYVWVGLPLAIVVFFGAQLAALFRKQASKARDELVAAVRNLQTQSGKTLEAAMSELGETFAHAFPILGFSSRLTEYLNRPLFVWLARLASKDAAGSEALQKSVAYANRIISGLSGVGRLLSVVYYLLLLAFTLGSYVWELYPRIPKAYGGGAPITVRLVLSKGAFPISLLADLGVASLTPDRDPTHGVQTDTLTLLYSTTGAYYVRTRSSRTVALSAGSVEAIIWP